MTLTNKRAKKNRRSTNETTLIHAVARKDKEALKQLFESYHKRVFRFAFKLTNDFETANDVTSDVFVTIWEKAGSYKGNSPLSTWIFGIARNKIRTHYRKKQHFVDIEETTLSNDTRDSINTRQDLKYALGHLSLEHREAVEMIFYLGFSYDEAAEIIGCPVGTVKSRIFHAKKLLEHYLSIGRRSYAS